MVINNERQTCKGQVKIGKHDIEQVAQSTWELYLIISSHGNPIYNVSTKLSSGAWAVLKLRNYVDINTLKTALFILTFSIVFQAGKWLQNYLWNHWK